LKPNRSRQERLLKNTLNWRDDLLAPNVVLKDEL
jgi:hypothetical protein